jgi:hypothetical protein
MDNEAIQVTILQSLYRARSENPKGIYNLHALADEAGIEGNALWRNWEYLKGKGLTQSVTSGGGVELSDWGMLQVERLGIAPEELARENNRVRGKILQALAKALAGAPAYSMVHYTQVLQETGVTENQFHANIGVLEFSGYTEWAAVGFLRLTASGLDKAREIEERYALIEAFEALQHLPPQERGLQLEKVLERVLASQGWIVRRDVRPEGEQLDLVLQKGREYYMAECKWEKNPVEAAAIREFSSRLRKRVGMHGIFISMSGFTSGAAEEAKTFLMERLILLFDRSDVEAIVYGHRSFDDLLSEKIDAAVVRREIQVGTGEA